MLTMPTMRPVDNDGVVFVPSPSPDGEVNDGRVLVPVSGRLEWLRDVLWKLMVLVPVVVPGPVPATVAWMERETDDPARGICPPPNFVSKLESAIYRPMRRF